jgi:hypothetical protein
MELPKINAFKRPAKLHPLVGQRRHLERDFTLMILSNRNQARPGTKEEVAQQIVFARCSSHQVFFLKEIVGSECGFFIEISE